MGLHRVPVPDLGQQAPRGGRFYSDVLVLRAIENHGWITHTSDFPEGLSNFDVHDKAEFRPVGRRESIALTTSGAYQAHVETPYW